MGAKHAIDFATYLRHTAGPELMEACDRVIGAQIHSVSAEDALRALKAFTSAKTYVRPKVITLLIRKLAKDLEGLETRNLITFADILMSTGNDDMIKRTELDKFLLSRLSSLTPSQLVQAILVFGPSEHTEVQAALETYIVGNMDLMSIHTAIDLLYFLGRTRTGSNPLLKSLIGQIEKQSNEVASLDVSQLFTLMVACNLTGMGPESAAVNACASTLHKNLSELSDGEKAMLAEILHRSGTSGAQPLVQLADALR